MTTNKRITAKPSWAIAYAKQTWPNIISRRLAKLNKSARDSEHLSPEQKVEAKWIAAAVRGIASALEEACKL